MKKWKIAGLVVCAMMVATLFPVAAEPDSLDSSEDVSDIADQEQYDMEEDRVTTNQEQHDREEGNDLQGWRTRRIKIVTYWKLFGFHFFKRVIVKTETWVSHNQRYT